MHNAEQERDLSSDNKGHFEKVQRPYVGTDRDWESAIERGRTSFCSSFRSVRNSAITRSIAWYALLKTPIFIWMETLRNSTIGQ